MQRRHFRHLGKPTWLGIVSMLFAVGLAAVDTIWSIYLFRIVQSDVIVGLISGLLTVTAVLFFFTSAPIIERFSESKIYIVTAMLSVIGYAVFSIIDTLIPFLVIAVTITIIGVLRRESFGITVRDSAKDSEIGKVEGVLYAIDNIGWVVGPLIAGLLLAFGNLSTVFLASSLFMIFAAMVFYLVRVRDIDHNTVDEGTIKSSIRSAIQFFRDTERVKAYLLTGGISFYWAAIYIYVPLFLIEGGFQEWVVGAFLLSVAVPLMIFEYPIGKACDSRGCRPFIMIGYSALALVSLLAFVYYDLWFIMIAFFLASIGAAFIESTVETYFFRSIRQDEEEKFYGPYQTSYDVFSAVSKLIGAAVLAIAPSQYLFLMLTIAMGACFLIASGIRSRNIAV